MSSEQALFKHHLNIDCLLLGSYCYRMLFEENSAETLKAAIASFDEELAEHTGYRLIREFELLFDRPVFRTSRGRGVLKRGTEDHGEDIHLRERQDRQMTQVRAVIAALELLLQRKATIRLGVAGALEKRALADVILQCAQLHKKGIPPLEAIRDKPEFLRERGDRGELDLYVTSCPPDFHPSEGELEGSWEVPLRIICPMSHPVERGLSDETLSDAVVALLRPRDPIPDYPHIPASARTVWYDSFDDCYIAATRGAVTFGFPELLTQEERTILTWLPFPTAKQQTMRFCLVWPNRARLRPEEELQAIMSLKKSIKDRLDELFAKDAVDLGVHRDKLVFHVSTLGKSQLWVVGVLRLKVLSNGALTGEHRVFPPQTQDTKGQYPGPFFISGNLTQNQRGGSQLVWEGRESRFGRISQEVYVSSFVIPPGLSETSAWVGIWSGKQTWDRVSSEESASIGFFVVVNDNREEAAKLWELWDHDHEQARLLAIRILRTSKPHKIVESHQAYLKQLQDGEGSGTRFSQTSAIFKLNNPRDAT